MVAIINGLYWVPWIRMVIKLCWAMLLIPKNRYIICSFTCVLWFQNVADVCCTFCLSPYCSICSLKCPNFIFFRHFIFILNNFSIFDISISPSVIVNRFKDYIPAKYHPLYEQYLETNDGTLWHSKYGTPVSFIFCFSQVLNFTFYNLRVLIWYIRCSLR